MAFGYLPQKLLDVEEKIKKIHLVKEAENREDESQMDLYSLIMEIVSWRAENIKPNIFSMTFDKVKKVIAYIPSNKFDVDLDNLMKVYEYRKNDKVARLLFDEWQKAYNNADCNKYVEKLFIEDDEFRKCLEKMQLNQSEIKSIFSGDSIPIKFGEIIISRKMQEFSMIDQINNFGLDTRKKLGQDIYKYYYTYCDKNAYLLLDNLMIISIIVEYDIYFLRLFLINFLKCLSMGELRLYFVLLEYLMKVIGKEDSISYVKFFETIEKDIREKYNNWVGIKIIEDRFGKNDDRNLFWRQFQFSKIDDEYPISNVIVFKTDDICFVEFLGRELGPIYWFERKYFENKMHRFFRRETNGVLRKDILKPMAIEVLLLNQYKECLNIWKHNWIVPEVIDGAPGMLGRKNHDTYYNDKKWLEDMRKILIEIYGVKLMKD